MRYRPSFVLRRALEAAREALGRLEAKQVPAQLLPIVRSAEWTPPLEDLTIKALTEFAWLREKAIAEWSGIEDATGSDRAAAQFLLRPDGWEAVVVRAAWESGRESGIVAADRARKEAEAARRERDEARRKFRDARAEADRLGRDLKAAGRAAEGPERAERQAVARAQQDLARAEEKARAAEAAWQTREQELRSEIERLQEAVRRAREERAEAVARFEAQRGGSGWAGSGVDLALLLDQIAIGATRVLPDDEVTAGHEPVRLPAGVRPDSAEAVDIVLAHQGPVHVLVDGYNAGLLLGGGDPAEVRDRLGAVLARLRILARPPRALTVVYDSSEGSASRDRPAGVEVVFTDAATTADDELVRMAAVPGAVVVSNDREVRERATAVGALAIWSDALVAWTRRR